MPFECGARPLSFGIGADRPACFSSFWGLLTGCAKTGAFVLPTAGQSCWAGCLGAVRQRRPSALKLLQYTNTNSPRAGTDRPRKAPSSSFKSSQPAAEGPGLRRTTLLRGWLLGRPQADKSRQLVPRTVSGGTSSSTRRGPHTLNTNTNTPTEHQTINNNRKPQFTTSHTPYTHNPPWTLAQTLHATPLQTAIPPLIASPSSPKQSTHAPLSNTRLSPRYSTLPVTQTFQGGQTVKLADALSRPACRGQVSPEIPAYLPRRDIQLDGGELTLTSSRTLYVGESAADEARRSSPRNFRRERCQARAQSHSKSPALVSRKDIKRRRDRPALDDGPAKVFPGPSAAGPHAGRHGISAGREVFFKPDRAVPARSVPRRAVRGGTSSSTSLLLGRPRRSRESLLGGPSAAGPPGR